jgi:pimeloyl-ACP methyl ester carboxylesterase
MLRLQSQWNCEVHGIWGEWDALYTGKMDLLKDRLKHCQLKSFHVVLGAGHWVQFEQANKFNQLLLQCLA